MYSRTYWLEIDLCPDLNGWVYELDFELLVGRATKRRSHTPRVAAECNYISNQFRVYYTVDSVQNQRKWRTKHFTIYASLNQDGLDLYIMLYIQSNTTTVEIIQLKYQERDGYDHSALVKTQVNMQSLSLVVTSGTVQITWCKIDYILYETMQLYSLT
jgi:hypothetical protein